MVYCPYPVKREGTHMSLSDAIISVFSQYANFSGRARRSEYWYFVLFNIVFATFLEFLGSLIPILSWLSILFGIAVIVPGLAVAFRRLHDTGRSGAFLLLALIPLVSLVVVFWCCQDSQPGTNQYGPCPKDQVW